MADQLALAPDAVMTKTCCWCKLRKPLEAFAFRSVATGEPHGHCRACQKAYRRRHYERNRETYNDHVRAQMARRRSANKRLIHEYLLQHPCVDCGEADPIVLEFDHRDPKTKEREVAFIRAHSPWQRVLGEIEKCDVRCVNCHRRRTRRQFGRARRNTGDGQ